MLALQIFISLTGHPFDEIKIYHSNQPPCLQDWRSERWWSTCHVSKSKTFTAQRITGVCASPGATWEPPRAARQLSGLPVSRSMSLSSQTDHIVLRKGYSSTDRLFPMFTCVWEEKATLETNCMFWCFFILQLFFHATCLFPPPRPEEELWAGPPRHWGASEWHDCVALSSPRGSACGWGEGFLHFKQVTFSPVLPGEEQPYVWFT